jgi:hypothetical protein
MGYGGGPEPCPEIMPVSSTSPGSFDTILGPVADFAELCPVYGALILLGLLIQARGLPFPAPPSVRTCPV